MLSCSGWPSSTKHPPCRERCTMAKKKAGHKLKEGSHVKEVVMKRNPQPKPTKVSAFQHMCTCTPTHTPHNMCIELQLDLAGRAASDRYAHTPTRVRAHTHTHTREHAHPHAHGSQFADPYAYAPPEPRVIWEVRISPDLVWLI